MGIQRSKEEANGQNHPLRMRVRRPITAIRQHMSTDHPALLDTVGREDLLGWIQVE
jgi:hypothetical protein